MQKTFRKYVWLCGILWGNRSPLIRPQHHRSRVKYKWVWGTDKCRWRLVEWKIQQQVYTYLLPWTCIRHRVVDIMDHLSASTWWGGGRVCCPSFVCLYACLMPVCLHPGLLSLHACLLWLYPCLCVCLCVCLPVSSVSVCQLLQFHLSNDHLCRTVFKWLLHGSNLAVSCSNSKQQL